MTIFFNDPYLEQLYNGEEIKGKPKYQTSVIEKFIKRVDTMKSLDNAGELLKLKSLNFERLIGQKNHLHSVRVNNQYRIEFELNNKDEIKLADIAKIESLSTHYE